MARFFVSPESICGRRFVLSGSEARHALAVLRKKVGDELDIFDGKDASYRGRIDAVGRHEIQGALLESLPPIRLPVQITLFQALTKSSKWEWLLEKSCEIGVSRVVPLLTRRSLVALETAQAREKLKRWSRLALAASKQCGRADLMAVELPCSLAAAFARLDKTHLSLIPWEKEVERSIQAACGHFHGPAVNIFIGPEGGWDPAEIQSALHAGAVPVRLGPTLLRTETAGLVAATLVLREFGAY